MGCGSTGAQESDHSLWIPLQVGGGGLGDPQLASSAAGLGLNERSTYGPVASWRDLLLGVGWLEYFLKLKVCHEVSESLPHFLGRGKVVVRAGVWTADTEAEEMRQH